ncbi:MAG: radical SAM family heme chaperone HemW [Alloprevotella sp.]|nr:radical SAM family heme chaperone HemW [Alloprevotella sp.]
MILSPALYVHVPYCKSRCAYCDFYSCHKQDAGIPTAQYVKALTQEMKGRAREAGAAGSDGGKPGLYSLYFGGGTPSLLSEEEWHMAFEAVHAHFHLPTSAEQTVELNPDDVTPALARCLKSQGVNRVSLGVQSLDDGTLRLLQRRHDAQQAVAAIETLHRTGFDNISADLIYGLPMQTTGAFHKDLLAMLRLPITHLSAYALSIEPGTLMARRVESGDWKPADEETSLAMYTDLMDTAAAEGWEHYEISNFARPGFRSRHNSAYWAQRPYIGLGPSAASYDGRRLRRVNLPDLASYVHATLCGHDAPHEDERLSDDELYNEIIMTRMRTREGLPLHLLSAKDRAELLRSAEAHLRRGLLVLEDESLRLTRAALFVSDDVLSDLMRC